MIDILAIGAHPDDVELGCAGTLLKQKEKGCSIVILDLTEGELGTRGNRELRKLEAKEAAAILGIERRMNLGLRDGFFKADEDQILKLIEVLRDLQPNIVLCNSKEDRHPDHGRAAEFVKQACFLSGLTKIRTVSGGKDQAVWRPKYLYNYIQFKYLKPDFTIDITAFKELKMKSILAYKSQFYNPDSTEPETYISSKAFLESQEARMTEFGHSIGVKYAEGFTADRTIGVADLRELQ